MDDFCPECGGTERRHVSPGLVECESQVAYTDTAMVDDPGFELAYGTPGMTPQLVTRYRTCGHVYEVDTPTSTAECQLGPKTSLCGAFATGTCSDCRRYVCRHHAKFQGDRLLCNECIGKGLAEFGRKRAAVLVELQERELAKKAAAEATADRLQQVWRSLPELSVAEVTSFLHGSEPVDFTDEERPVFAGRRLPVLTAEQFFYVVRDGGFRAQPGKGPWRNRLVGGYHPRIYVWPFGRQTGTRYERGSRVSFTTLSGFLKGSGQLVQLSYAEGLLWQSAKPAPAWTSTAQEYETARQTLQAGK